MIPSHWRRTLTALALCFLLTLAACASKPPSPYEQVQEETSGRGAPAAVSKEAQQGAKFNKFFPSGVRGYEIVPTQEKKGFAEYKVKKEGKTLAMLSISDTASIPSAAAKYEDSTLTIAGYPSVEQGTTATGILVNGRYQVKVLSRDPAFTPEDRAAWLQKFDLKGLAQLQSARPSPGTAPAAKAPDLSPQPAS